MSLPFIVNSLDNETQCRTDAVHILIHNLLDDRSLPCIVQTTAPSQQRTHDIPEIPTASGFASPCP
jgi:hypothetical protein